MSLRIHNDYSRFNAIIKGKIRQSLKDYIKKGGLFVLQDKKQVKIPLSNIDIPQFRFGSEQQKGIGQGQAQEGSSLNKNKASPDSPQAGNLPQEHDHSLDMTISLDEMAEILGAELGLPKIKPKGQANLKSLSAKYSGIHSIGPQSLRHLRRTFKNALKRQIVSGVYDEKNPIIIPVREDLRYRSRKSAQKPKANAVIIYMMDVSGSMGEEQKEIVRIQSFWLDLWLRKNYDGLEVRYIIHDAIAREVDQDVFFHTHESGGTMISSAYRLCSQIINSDYDNSLWNIYPFHFSDGDNWSIDDTKLCISLLKKQILPKVNQFAYAQVESPYGSGQFIRDLRESLKANTDTVVLSEIKNRGEIYNSIQDFLKSGN